MRRQLRVYINCFTWDDVNSVQLWNITTEIYTNEMSPGTFWFCQTPGGQKN